MWIIASIHSLVIILFEFYRGCDQFFYYSHALFQLHSQSYQIQAPLRAATHPIHTWTSTKYRHSPFHSFCIAFGSCQSESAHVNVNVRPGCLLFKSVTLKKMIQVRRNPTHPALQAAMDLNNTFKCSHLSFHWLFYCSWKYDKTQVRINEWIHQSSIRFCEFWRAEFVSKNSSILTTNHAPTVDVHT